MVKKCIVQGAELGRNRFVMVARFASRHSRGQPGVDKGRPISLLESGQVRVASALEAFVTALGQIESAELLDGCSSCLVADRFRHAKGFPGRAPAVAISLVMR